MHSLLEPWLRREIVTIEKALEVLVEECATSDPKVFSVAMMTFLHCHVMTAEHCSGDEAAALLIEWLENWRAEERKRIG